MLGATISADSSRSRAPSCSMRSMARSSRSIELSVRSRARSVRSMKVARMDSSRSVLSSTVCVRCASVATSGWLGRTATALRKQARHHPLHDRADGRSPSAIRPAGQRAELWSGGGVSLAAKSDGFVTGVRHSSYGSMPVSAHAWRARLLVEAGLESRPQDALLSGLVELGARLDGGDASASRTPASAWGSPAAGACCWCTRTRTSASGARARP